MSAIQELQNYTFVSKYARWIESENRRETWKEAVDRVKNMMLKQYSDKEVSEVINGRRITLTGWFHEGFEKNKKEKIIQKNPRVKYLKR